MDPPCGAMRRIRVLDQEDAVRRHLGHGAAVIRRSWVMVAPLVDGVAPVATGRVLPPGHAVEPLDPGRLADYGALMARAYPPDHPDHEPGDASPDDAAGTMASYLGGTVVGPLVAAGSRHVVDAAGDVVGVIVVSNAPGDDAFAGGPWVTDLFVDPARARLGLGSLLVTAACCRLHEVGEQHLGLAVTHGNPALQLYERLGFEVRHESWLLELDHDRPTG